MTTVSHPLRSGVFFLILISCVGCDQVAKTMARQSLAASDPVLLLNGLVRLEYAENQGAFLSLGAGLPEEARFLLFVVLTSGILVAMVVLALHDQATPAQLLGLSLVAGGGAGNLVDRIVLDGTVVDFLSLGIGPVRTGIFNLADVAITAGALLLATLQLRALAERSPAEP